MSPYVHMIKGIPVDDGDSVPLDSRRGNGPPSLREDRGSERRSHIGTETRSKLLREAAE